MKKIFLYNPNSKNTYLDQIIAAYKIMSKKEKNLSLLDVNKIENKFISKFDIIIANNLPKSVENYARKKKIILIYLDSIKKKKNCDVIIDYKHTENTTELSGKYYKINKNLSCDFDYFSFLNVIIILDWDTNFWGYPVSLVTSRKLTESIIYRIKLFIKKNKIRLVQYLCNCHDRKSVYLAEQNHFQFKDIRLTFEKKLENNKNKMINQNYSFRKAKNEDINMIYKISDTIYKDSRYYFDQNFDRKKIQDFYNQWLYKAVNNLFDDVCLIYCRNKKPISYCTLRYINNKDVVIGLFGVSKNFKGKGIGNKLINNVFDYLKIRGYKKISVVTQGRNLYAQRFYQKSGFVTKNTELWYHKWI